MDFKDHFGYSGKLDGRVPLNDDRFILPALHEIENLRYKTSDEEVERLLRKACDKFREIDTEEV